jgi:hypothetical protein
MILAGYGALSAVSLIGGYWLSDLWQRAQDDRPGAG